MSTPHLFSSVEENAITGYGLLDLQRSRDVDSQFRVVFKLDIFHSNNQRDWLWLRWDAPALSQTVLYLHQAKELQVIFSFQEKSFEKARAFAADWVGAVCLCFEKLKEARR